MGKEKGQFEFGGDVKGESKIFVSHHTEGLVHV